MASQTATVAPQTTRRIALALWAFSLAWAGVIFEFSSRPGSQIPGRFAEIGHFSEYFVFGVLLYSALRASGRRDIAASMAIIVASLYGMSDEFHQHFVAMRTPDVVDWGVDTVGTACGVFAAYVTIRTTRHRQQRRAIEPPQ